MARPAGIFQPKFEKMVKTAASIFSPDEGGPLVRRKRVRFPTTVQTFSTRVKLVAVYGGLHERGYWKFPFRIIVDGANSPELKINGQSPTAIFQNGLLEIRAMYSFTIQPGHEYTIDETPTNVIFDPPCFVPQSGVVTFI